MLQYTYIVYEQLIEDEGIGKSEAEADGVDKAVGENVSDSEKCGRGVRSSLSRDSLEWI
jgi:hypothetical protein